MTILDSEKTEIENKDEFIKELVEGRYIGRSYYPHERTKFSIVRKWNSWYPSYFDVCGGCYAIITSDQVTDSNSNSGVIVIDPGFKFIPVLKKTLNIEPQDVKKVIVTHYHPDHVAGLVEFATLKHAARSKCEVFLNRTCFDAFRQIQGEFVTLHEIDKNQTERLAEYTTTDGTKESIFLTATEAHHEELGNSHRALGLKFRFLRNNKRIFLIGIMGDTDGNPAYVSHYVRDFIDTDLLILHLGTLFSSNFSVGHKHLYYQGVEAFLEEFKRKLTEEYIEAGIQQAIPRKTVVLSEFGLELGTIDQIADALEPSRRSLDWRLAPILAKKIRSKNSLFQQKMYSRMMAEYLMNLDSTTSRRSLEEFVLALGLAVLSVGSKESLEKDLPTFSRHLDEDLRESKGLAWELRLSFGRSMAWLKSTCESLVLEGEKLTLPIFQEILEISGQTRFDKVKSACELLKYEIITMVSKPHLPIIIDPISQFVLDYADSIQLLDWVDDLSVSPERIMKLDWVLPAALLGLLTLYSRCNSPFSGPNAQNSHSPKESTLLQIAQSLQEPRRDWCRILVGDFGSIFSYDDSGNGLTCIDSGEWVSPWDVKMQYSPYSRSIVYKSAAVT